jgi:hypothetical protein
MRADSKSAADSPAKPTLRTTGVETTTHAMRTAYMAHTTPKLPNSVIGRKNRKTGMITDEVKPQQARIILIQGVGSGGGSAAAGSFGG